MTRWILMLALLVGLAAPAAAGDDSAPQDPELDGFVYSAVLEGLSTQGLPDATVDRLLAVDPEGRPVSFIPGCPICMPSMRAFRDWRARPDRSAASPASPERVAALSQDDDLGRTSALARLVRELVSRRIATAGWSESEAEAWSGRFEAAAREGQRQLVAWQAKGVATYRAMWSCMICDAATRACPRK